MMAAGEGGKRKSPWEKKDTKSGHSGSSGASKRPQPGQDRRRSVIKKPYKPPNPFELREEERLQKVLAHAGVDSRRACEQLILDGRVKVNGKMVTEIGTKVNMRTDVVAVDGKRVEVRPPHEVFWVALYKPKGVITSVSDEKGRKTVIDLVPSASKLRLVPVGRLDRDTAGLLLMTNDLPWVNALTHPSFGHEKRYRVVVDGSPTTAEWQQFADGMMLEGEVTRTSPCTVELGNVGPRGERVAFVTLREGRYRQLRRMFEALGYPILALTRLSVGPIGLSDMRPSEWRRLTPTEITRLKQRTALPASKLSSRRKKTGNLDSGNESGVSTSNIGGGSKKPKNAVDAAAAAATAGVDETAAAGARRRLAWQNTNGSRRFKEDEDLGENEGVSPARRNNAAARPQFLRLSTAGRGTRRSTVNWRKTEAASN